MTNKKGMTLVEILVYIVLAGMLLAPVIMLVQNSSVNMARDASYVNLRMSGRELLNIIYDDLRNTGFKLNNFTAVREASYTDWAAFDEHKAACEANPTSDDCPAKLFDDNGVSIYDVSSFMPFNKVGGDNYDALTIRKGRLNSTGGWDDIDTITYRVNDVNNAKELIRSVKGKSNQDGATVKLSRNVEALKFRYSIDLVEWYDAFGADDIDVKNNVQYIKVIMVTKDPKKLSPTKTTSITLIEPSGADAPGLTLERNDLALYERHEIVVPIPNNGLFP